MNVRVCQNFYEYKMELIDVVAIITFVILLICAIAMLINFYVCDSHKCKAFDQASKVGLPGTKEFTIALLEEMYNDGIWPIPYIGASILTPLSLWFLGVDITVRNFAIIFFVSFVVIYFMLAFFGHHYIRPITKTVTKYIENVCVAPE
jgi:hypothetical protein